MGMNDIVPEGMDENYNKRYWMLVVFVVCMFLTLGIYRGFFIEKPQEIESTIFQLDSIEVDTIYMNIQFRDIRIKDIQDTIIIKLN